MLQEFSQHWLELRIGRTYPELGKFQWKNGCPDAGWLHWKIKTAVLYLDGRYEKINISNYCCFALLTNSAGVITKMSKSLNPFLSRVIITSGWYGCAERNCTPSSKKPSRSPHEVDDDIGIEKNIHRALSSHISSSSLSKSTPSGSGPKVIAITLGDGL